MTTSLLYNSLLFDAFSARFDFAVDTFKVMLVNAYSANAEHSRRSDILGEVVGTGYVPGGAAIQATVTEAADGSTQIVLTGAAWWVSRFVATGAVYYKARGGPALDDELICYVDFGEEVSALNGTFFLDKSSISLSAE